MRVLLVCHGYPPFGVAGVERLPQQTATTLRARGHDVTVLTRRPTAAPPTFQLVREVRDGVPVVTIAGAGATHGRYPGHERDLELAFERMLAELEPDVVLLSHLLHHSPGYVDVAHRWGIPVVLELHDFFCACPRAHLDRLDGSRCGGPEGGLACAAHCFGHEPADLARARWSLRAHTFRQALRTADAVVLPIASRRRLLRRDARGDAASIEVIGNGVPAGFRRARRPQPDPSAPLRCRLDRRRDSRTRAFTSSSRRCGWPRSCRPLASTIFGATTRGYDERLIDAADEVDGLELRLFGSFERAAAAGAARRRRRRRRAVAGGGDLLDRRRAGASPAPAGAGLSSRRAAGRDPRRRERAPVRGAGDAIELGALLARSSVVTADGLAGSPTASALPAAITVEERTEQLERLLSETLVNGSRAGRRSQRSRRAEVPRDALATALR